MSALPTTFLRGEPPHWTSGQLTGGENGRRAGGSDSLEAAPLDRGFVEQPRQKLAAPSMGDGHSHLSTVDPADRFMELMDTVGVDQVEAWSKAGPAQEMLQEAATATAASGSRLPHSPVTATAFSVASSSSRGDNGHTRAGNIEADETERTDRLLLALRETEAERVAKAHTGRGKSKKDSSDGGCHGTEQKDALQHHTDFSSPVRSSACLSQPFFTSSSLSSCTSSSSPPSLTFGREELQRNTNSQQADPDADRCAALPPPRPSALHEGAAAPTTGEEDVRQTALQSDETVLVATGRKEAVGEVDEADEDLLDLLLSPSMTTTEAEAQRVGGRTNEEVSSSPADVVAAGSTGVSGCGREEVGAVDDHQDGDAATSAVFQEVSKRSTRGMKPHGKRPHRTPPPPPLPLSLTTTTLTTTTSTSGRHGLGFSGVAKQPMGGDAMMDTTTTTTTTTGSGFPLPPCFPLLYSPPETQRSTKPKVRLQRHTIYSGDSSVAAEAVDQSTCSP